MLAATVAVMYLLLFALVRRGSKTIDAQQRELSSKVTQLMELGAKNEQLHERVRRAAGRTAALNEVFLRRISADLHDGPGQDMGLALMQFELIGKTCLLCPGGNHGLFSTTAEFHAIQNALQSALNDLRAISAGLQLPEIDKLSIPEIVARAIRDYERKAGSSVELGSTAPPAPASLSVKITLYRLLQESLTNGFRHASGLEQRVHVSAESGWLKVEVSDRGLGFDANRLVPEGHMGLAGMRERVEILGGTFDLQSIAGKGTTIRVVLPLVVPGLEQELG
jgi:signal transduction histidine kinase